MKHKNEIIKKDDHIKILQLTSELAIQVMEKRNVEIKSKKPKIGTRTKNEKPFKYVCFNVN